MSHMKKTLHLIAMVLLCLLFSSTADTKELSFTTQEFAPFSYEVDHAAAGPVVESIKAVCQGMAISCTFAVLPWTRAQEYVKTGKANGMFLIGWTEERSGWLHFSPPILHTEYGVFVRTDNPLEFKNPVDLKGYTIGVYGPSSTSVSLDSIRTETGDLTIDLRPDDESGFIKLSQGRVDAVYSNKDVGYALMGKLSLTNIRYAGRSKKIKYYIGFSQQYTDRDLVERFNATCRELQKNGTIPEILKKYSLEPDETEY